MRTKVYDIVIVGAGAAGIIAALSASREFKFFNRNHKIVLLERSSRVGRKILVTGNGKCNISNKNISNKFYYSNNNEKISSVIHDFLNKEIEFFNSIGLVLKEDLDGRLYPRSEQASSVLDLLRLEIENLGIEQICDFRISCISKLNNEFLVDSNDVSIRARKLVIATGGMSAPFTGYDKCGYNYMRSFGHSIIEPFPALVPIKVSNPYLKILKGARCRCRLDLVADDNIIKTEYGEVQFTENALSGICIFQISRLVSEFIHKRTVQGKNCNNVFIYLDLMHENNENEIKNIFTNNIRSLKHLSIENFLIGMFNKRVTQALLKEVGLNPNILLSSLDKEFINLIIKTIKSWKFVPNGVMTWKNSQVTAGGIPLVEFDCNTLESNKVSGLYAAGEILDVDGICGGYNLYWAWSSGYVAGKSAAKSIIGIL